VGAWSVGASSCLRVLWRLSTHALAGARVTGHVWARRVPVNAGHEFVESKAGQVQETERELLDMAKQAGGER
jgi:hypothetical protein